MRCQSQSAFAFALLRDRSHPYAFAGWCVQKEPADRVGSAGFAEIRSHAFFASIDWEGLARTVPPIVPDLSHPTDTK